MLKLHPIPDAVYDCPRCGTVLTPKDWLISGLFSLARLRCDPCAREYWGVLPTGHGLFYPGLIDIEGRTRHDDFGRNWYLGSLKAGFDHPTDDPVTVHVEKLRPMSRKRRVLLNTLDMCYGHSVFRLFNAQHYLDREDADLVVLVQRPLRWMVPDGVAEVWVVDLPFKDKGGAGGWSNALAAEVRRLVTQGGIGYLAVAFPQPDKSDYTIERFTRVKPFPLDEWDQRLERPTVTFIWRGDRWSQPLLASRPFRLARMLAPGLVTPAAMRYQEAWLGEFGRRLRRRMPRLDFAVAGLGGSAGRLAPWIKDLRVPRHTDESARGLCERYAASHLVIGVNGSNLLVPGDHAGAVMNLTPRGWWAVSFGEFPHRITEYTDTMFRYALVPGASSMSTLVNIAGSILLDRSSILIHTAREWTDHATRKDRGEWGRYRLDATRRTRRVTAGS